MGATRFQHSLCPGLRGKMLHLKKLAAAHSAVAHTHSAVAHSAHTYSQCSCSKCTHTSIFAGWGVVGGWWDRPDLAEPLGGDLRGAMLHGAVAAEAVESRWFSSGGLVICVKQKKGEGLLCVHGTLRNRRQINHDLCMNMKANTRIRTHAHTHTCKAAEDGLYNKIRFTHLQPL